MKAPIGRLSTKGAKGGGPPVFSQEFFILNHADIISTICIVIFIGLLFKPTHELASSFIFVQYNISVEENVTKPVTGLIESNSIPLTLYRHGILDYNNVMFYTLIWIIIHAVMQQYIWERTAKKAKQSKRSISKYYDSGALIVFYLLSALWGVDHIIKEGYFWNLSLIWEGYPHDKMTFSLKFFMLQQMAFWLHCYPEIYLMKQKDDIYKKLVLYTSSLLIIVGAYVIKLQRLAIILLTMHYTVELLFHLARVVKYHSKGSIPNKIYKVWRVLFLTGRIVTVILSVLTLWFGLGREARKDSQEPPSEEEEAWPKQFNTPLFRAICLAFVLGIQAWITWTFLVSQMKHHPPGSTQAEKPSDKKKKKSD